MNIPIDQLKLHKLTPNEFCLMYLIHTKDYSSLYGEDGNILRMSNQEIVKALQSLESKRFIKIHYDIEKTGDTQYSLISIRSSFLTLLENKYLPVADDKTHDTDLFKELRGVYPKETPNGRRLHTNLASSEKRYLAAIKGNLELHKNILKAVTFEYNKRIQQSSLNYMSALSTYINQRGWEVYIDDVSKGNEETGNGNKWTNIL